MALKQHPADLDASEDTSAISHKQDPLITTLHSLWTNERVCVHVYVCVRACVHITGDKLLEE